MTKDLTAIKREIDNFMSSRPNAMFGFEFGETYLPINLNEDAGTLSVRNPNDCSIIDVEIDEDRDLDFNLEGLYDKIIEECPELIIE